MYEEQMANFKYRFKAFMQEIASKSNMHISISEKSPTEEIAGCRHNLGHANTICLYNITV
jgi:hypothetical protein